MRPPGSAVDRVGSSGNREIRRRISETVSAHAQFNRISRDLSGFGDDEDYLKEGRRNMRPP